MKLKNLAKPLFVRRISGDSMLPTLHDRQIILGTSILKPKTGRIIVFNHDKLEKIKRLKSLEDNNLYVVGDNADKSVDSRCFGKIQLKDYLGRVIFPKV
jgi:phage repressor protein C with HTH and peptisase S24 domain